MSAVTGRLLRAEEVDDDLAQAWDALPAGRGTQADFQDSHTWYDPGTFWSGEYLPLAPGWSYGPEVAVGRDQ